MGVSEYIIKKFYEEDKDFIFDARIDKVLKINERNFAFIIYNQNKSKTLLFSLEPNLPIYLLGESLVSFIEETNGFFAILKKHLEYGRIIDFTKVDNDRIIKFKIRKKLPNYVYETTTLIFEMIPMRANIILVNENDVIIDAYHKSEALDEKYAIVKGLKYHQKDTTSRAITFDDDLESIKYKISRKEFNYLSSLNNEEFSSALKILANSKEYYLLENDISCLPLNQERPLQKAELFEALFKKRETEGRRKHYQKLISLIEKKCTTLAKKIQNLESDLKKCENYSSYQEYGTLLFYGSPTYKKGDKEVIIEGVKIPLKEDKNLQDNAKEYFKKYKKAKSGINQIKEQIIITEKDLSYFEELKTQIQYANDEDYKQISKQLENDGYLKVVNKGKKTKEAKVFNPHIINYSNVKIGYGLSSFQNDYLTFTLAHKEDIFLHIKDYHGPHVIIFEENPSDDVLLFAGEVSLYFSNKTSGDVQYTQRRKIKKIPAKTGMVELLEYKLMHISSIRDASKSILDKLS